MCLKTFKQLTCCFAFFLLPHVVQLVRSGPAWTLYQCGHSFGPQALHYAEWLQLVPAPSRRVRPCPPSLHSFHLVSSYLLRRSDIRNGTSGRRALGSRARPDVGSVIWTLIRPMLSVDHLCGLVVTVPGYRSGVRFPELPDFVRSCGSGAGSTQPREYNWGSTWTEK
jgi:hypothetical protein